MKINLTPESWSNKETISQIANSSCVAHYLGKVAEIQLSRSRTPVFYNMIMGVQEILLESECFWIFRKMRQVKKEKGHPKMTPSCYTWFALIAKGTLACIISRTNVLKEL